MSIRRLALLALVLTFIALGANGCVLHRTVKEGGAVVSEGYIVKTPHIDP